MAPITIPSQMKAVVAPKYCKPKDYTISEVPTPEITKPDEVLIRVYAAGTTVGETLLANGNFSIITNSSFPMIMGLEGSGVVVAVGRDVKRFKAGDEVMGGSWTRPMIPLQYEKWMAEYTVTAESLLLPKPAHLSFEECAGILGSAVTAYQSFRRGFELMGEKSFEGKTVFVPAALSATGSIAVQMAKNVYGAARVISTVSTPKVSLVEKHLPGVVDHVLDYQKQDIVKEVGRGQVDFVYNTTWHNSQAFQMLKQQTGVMVSIAAGPTVEQMRLVLGEKMVPFWVVWLINVLQWWYDWKLRGTNIKRDFVSGHPGDRRDLEACGEMIAAGKIKPVSNIVGFDDLDGIKDGFTKLFKGKGGFGSLVVKIR
ncbi:hypothetical protein MCOR25_010607 [Pyricularia grisea]|uniref:Enoyl reductase (ER) domain-containing protein n=1 Tax=Pyricularia grisea TaxID=148305 RepID=A0A6P8B1Q0_PYRGI|nr:uncharacterized protein PgNI_07665 [Pyricularia grisea]KAI6350071.1 hypothetical protein MCOR25_010607 [Pyricularia grisea]TLD08787.1 hypothetical protein PgNI_07665 [Pyricularia grisea]